MNERRLGLLAAIGLAVLGLAVLAPGPARADEPPLSLEERLARTERRLDQQDQQLAELRAQNARLQRELAARPIAPPPIAEPSLLPTVRVSGFLQADAVLYRQSSKDEIDGATGAPLNDQRFLIRRARLRADAERGPIAGALELDANTVSGPQARILGAEISARVRGPLPGDPPILKATLGLFRVPFGYELDELDTHRLFLERSTVARAFFPDSYDLGVRLHGGYRFLRYSAAVMNGEPIGEKSFPALDPAAGKDLLIRLGVDTAVAPGIRVQAGASGLTGQGFHKGTPSTKDVLVWRDANENGIVESTEIQVIAGSAATASETYRRFALGGDLRLTAALPVLGELSIYGEVVRAQNLDRGVQIADPVSAGHDVRELGFYAGVTQELTRYALLGLRYDRYDPDADESEQRAAARVPKDSSFSTLAITGALRYAPARLIVEYDHNTNATGRTAGGLPTTLGDDRVALRGEVTF